MKESIFDELNKQLKKNEELWGQVDKLVEVLKSRPIQDTQTKLLLMLVDILRPANSTKQMQAAQEELNDLLSDLNKLARSK